MKLTDYAFRAIENRICFISTEGLAEEYAVMLNDFTDIEKANGVLAFCYVDHNEGVLFDVLCNAFMDADGNITAFDGNDENFLRLRKSAIDDLEVTILDLSTEYYNVYERKINTTMAQAKANSNEVADYIRTLPFLDGSRAMSYPDDVVVLLMKGERNPEAIFCRIEGMNGNNLTGVVLQGPTRDYWGVKTGDMLEFGVAEYMGGPACVCVLD